MLKSNCDKNLQILDTGYEKQIEDCFSFMSTFITHHLKKTTE